VGFGVNPGDVGLQSNLLPTKVPDEGIRAIAKAMVKVKGVGRVTQVPGGGDRRSVTGHFKTSQPGSNQPATLRRGLHNRFKG
jgi:hypothetical protein